MRRGENIHKRKDGRWEGRFISAYGEKGAIYTSVYAHTYVDCAEKLALAKCGMYTKNAPHTIDELFSKWLEARKNSVKNSTYVTYLTMYESHVKERFGGMKVQSVTSFMINRFVSDLLESGRCDGEGLSPKSVQAVLVMLKSVFAYGAREFHFDDPAKGVSQPKCRSKEIQIFSHEEMAKIRRAAMTSEDEDVGILLALYTGVRIGELCALRWEDIDLEKRIIHVNKTLQRMKYPDKDRGTFVAVTEPKSEHSVRDIPIPTFMLDRLNNMKCSGDCYFLTGQQKYAETRTYQYRYKRFLEKEGIEYKNFHVLRHTFATECIRLGIDVKTVSELLGHSSVKITLERYVHSDMETKRRQLERLYECI